MIRNLTVLAITAMVLAGCKKEPVFVVTLPAPTNTGANTLGFTFEQHKIWAGIKHGNFFLNSLAQDVPTATGSLYNEPNGLVLQLRGSMLIRDNNNKITDNSDFQVTIQNFDFSKVTYVFDTTRFGNWVLFNDNLNNKFYINADSTGFTFLINKIDTVRKTVSGTFSGLLFQKTGAVFNFSDVVNVQQGRFDIHYKQE